MVYFVTGVGLLILLIALGRAFIAADPRSLVRAIRFSLGGFLILIGGLLVIERQWWLALPLIGAGTSALSVGRIGPIDLGGSRRSRGTTSTVRAAFLEMKLDHDSGAMSGIVLDGKFAGASLDDLDEEKLKQVRLDIRTDGESLALFEAYLDRRFPGWREDVEGDDDAGTRRPADAGPMTDEEAYEVLGLAPGATDAEVRAAHRRLMMRMHPDQGGSTFLAAKINEAKDRLLGRRHR